MEVKVKKTAASLIILLSTILPIHETVGLDKPLVEQLSFSPKEIELLSSDTKIGLKLVISHPNGIQSTSTIATFRNYKGDSFATYLTRNDIPISLLNEKVIYEGTINIPLTAKEGVYNLEILPVISNSKSGYASSTGLITPKNIRSLKGGESGLLVRKAGELNFEYETFVGPSYDKTLGTAFNNSSMYNFLNTPIFRVGETLAPHKYFELRVPELSLQVESDTPKICSSDKKVLNFISEGTCSFIVSTPKTSEYSEKRIIQNVIINSARPKPKLFVGSVSNQNVKDLPKNVALNWVYGESGEYVFPTSKTPSVCAPSGFYVQVIAGGICILHYSSLETKDFLASDVYELRFEIVRDPQTMNFTPPATANLSAKTLALSATASSGGVITYQTTSTGICSITGSTLNLLKGGNCSITATQAGSATLAPISATATVMIAGSVAPTTKTITCVKGNKTKKVSGTNPKCLKGYKIKR